MSSYITRTSTPRKASGLKASVLPDGRWLLYNQSQRQAVTLSATAGILWELCDGHTPVSALIQQIQELYPDTPVSQIEAESLRTLQHFLEQELVTNGTA